MIRLFNITAPIITGRPSEFDVTKVLPFTMTLTHIKTSFRRDEGFLYLTISPEVCEGIDVAVLGDVVLHQTIDEGTEIRVQGIYTGRYPPGMSYDFPLPLSIALIGIQEKS